MTITKLSPSDHGQERRVMCPFLFFERRGYNRIFGMGEAGHFKLGVQMNVDEGKHD